MPRPDVALPLGEFAERAIEQNEVAKDGYCSPLFPFARMVKAHPDLEACDGAEAAHKIACAITGKRLVSMAQVERVLEDWFSMELEELPSDPLADFVRAFDAVHSPGGDVVDLALARAKALPLIPIHAVSAKYAEFVSLAGHLQVLAGPNDIILPVVKVGALLDRDHASVSSYRVQAIKRGLLRQTGDYNKLQRIATSFRFSVDCFDWDTGQQVQDLPLTNTRVNRVIRNIKTIKENRANKAPLNSSNFAAGYLNAGGEALKSRLNAEMARRAELQRQAEEMQKGNQGVQ